MLQQDKLYSPDLVADEAEEDSFESMDPAPVKDRSRSRRRHLDEKRAKNNSKKTLEIVLAKSEKLSDKATAEQKHRAENKCRNVTKKVHEKRN